MMFFVGGVVGWLAKDHVYQTQPVYTHPEMFDENGNLLPDEILAVRFENDLFMTNSTKKTTTRKPRATKPKAKAPAKRAPAKPIELPVNPFVFEILELASSQRSSAKKVEVLKKYEDNSVKSVLIWNFDDSVISMVPEGEVPYGDPNEQSVFDGSLSEKTLEMK